MKRLISDKLNLWKNQANRKPLILRGTRQVGKSWTVVEFGKSAFTGKVHVIDLEKRPDWHRIFKPNLDARRILAELEILLNSRIIPDTDLLFIDEIQECPQALMALRYFYEQIPELPVIAAGSLLEFVLNDISFPVGRVQMMNMYPMNFVEFLMATNQNMLADILLGPVEQLPDTIHERMLEELRKYFFIGGMPECVKTYIDTGSIASAFEIQADLIHAFRQDFSKYTPSLDRQCLNNVLSAAATKIGQQTKYAHLSEGFTNPTIKKSYELLCSARILYKIPTTSGAGLPFGASVNEKKFKTLIADIGLMRFLNHMPSDITEASENLLSIYRGSVAEQFVGQELISAGQALYYWSREAKSSTAEVDYLFERNGNIFPLEIKSGPSGKLRSLHLFLNTYPNCQTGFVLSTANYSFLPGQKLKFIPLYFAYSILSNITNTL